MITWILFLALQTHQAQPKPKPRPHPTTAPAKRPQPSKLKAQLPAPGPGPYDPTRKVPPDLSLTLAQRKELAALLPQPGSLGVTKEVEQEQAKIRKITGEDEYKKLLTWERQQEALRNPPSVKAGQPPPPPPVFPLDN